MPILSVIIVNYNTEDLLKRCLQSIATQTDADFEVIVVDNDSADNSVAIVKDTFPWVKLIANRENKGFAKANNQALKLCRAKYIYFLNPDTEVKKGALREMLAYMEAHKRVGLAGTRIENPDGSLQPSFDRRYPGGRHAEYILKGLKGDIAWVLGASIIARQDILNDLNGFDENFFLYGEEQDLCLRIRQAGWEIGYIEKALIVHWGAQSERSTPPVEIWQKKFNSEIIFYRKHYPGQIFSRIRRSFLMKAYWRMFTLKMSLPFCSDKKVCKSKLNKYRTVISTFS